MVAAQEAQAQAILQQARVSRMGGSRSMVGGGRSVVPVEGGLWWKGKMLGRGSGKTGVKRGEREESKGHRVTG